MVFIKCNKRLSTILKILEADAKEVISDDSPVVKKFAAKRIIKNARILKQMEAFYNKYTIYIYIKHLSNYVEYVRAFTNSDDWLEYGRNSDSRNSETIIIDVTLFQLIDGFIRLHKDDVTLLSKVMYSHDESDGLPMLIAELVENLFVSQELTDLFN